MRFIALRKRFYLFSTVLMFLALLAFFFVPKNYGIDMTGGLRISYSTPVPITQSTLDEIRSEILENYTFLESKIISDLIIYPIKGSLIRADIGLAPESDVAQSASRTVDVRTHFPDFFKKHDIVVTESSFVSVGQSFGKFVLDRAYLTLIVCLCAIALYLMFAFRHSIEGTSSTIFAGITILTLIHDVCIAAGIFILLSLIFPVLKVDTFFVTAILTTLGYSINDTIVILDRIRCSYRDRKGNDSRSDEKIFDDSINVSVRRSIYTSMAIFMVLLCMLIFGPEALVGFVTLMLLGTVFGTYSSIMIAAPLIYDINSWKK